MQRNRYDSRVVDRYVEKGEITKKDLESHMKGLPDETENAQWVQMDLEEAELNGDENAYPSETPTE